VGLKPYRADTINLTARLKVTMSGFAVGDADGTLNQQPNLRLNAKNSHIQHGPFVSPCWYVGLR
jgi:hypothetical protein